MKDSRLVLAPITIKAANDFVGKHHRHSKPTRGGRFALAAWLDGTLQGVAIVGRPVARNLDEATTSEVTRLCVLDDAPRGTPSFLYQAAKRAWQAMGGLRMLTYTLTTESGASLRGAGWRVAGRTRASKGWLNRPGRVDQAVYDYPKLRWEPTFKGGAT